MTIQIDAIDTKIINILNDNARLSFRQIAKKCKISVVTVMNRVKKMESEGIIRKYSPIINYERIGYGFHVMINLRVSKGKEVEVEKRLSDVENIFAIYDITGDWDVEIIAKFRKRKELDGFVKRLQTFENVERVHTKLVLNTIKEEPIRINF
ncbi:MAG: Lrp/AsnC family transcriptional regulator [Candidatus Woesearchaeota archaeon]